jgi:hypothetical protein
MQKNCFAANVEQQLWYVIAAGKQRYSFAQAACNDSKSFEWNLLCHD